MKPIEIHKYIQTQSGEQALFNGVKSVNICDEAGYPQDQEHGQCQICAAVVTTTKCTEVDGVKTIVATTYVAHYNCADGCGYSAKAKAVEDGDVIEIVTTSTTVIDKCFATTTVVTTTNTAATGESEPTSHFAISEADSSGGVAKGD